MNTIQIGDRIKMVESGRNNSRHPNYRHEYVLHEDDVGVVTALFPDMIYDNGKATIEVDGKYYVGEAYVKVIQSVEPNYEIF